MFFRGAGIFFFSLVKKENAVLVSQSVNGQSSYFEDFFLDLKCLGVRIVATTSCATFSKVTF